MIEYKVSLNNGIEAFGVDQKTITANEDVKTCDETALAREISHENPLIPEQVAKAVLENFCKATANLMAMGFAVQLRNGNDVALRIHPDIHVKGGNINLARAKELDPTVTELTVENAGRLVDKAGITVRAKAECEQKFTELLLAVGSSVSRNEVIERAKIVSNGSGNQGGTTPTTPTTPETPENPGTGGDNNGGGGDDDDSGVIS
jgi:hypothetical protein